MIGEPVSDQDVNNMIEVADLDKDGRIDYTGKIKKFTRKNREEYELDFMDPSMHLNTP